MAIQPDGKILVAESADIYNGSHFVNDLALARDNGDCTPGSSFGNKGKQITDITTQKFIKE